MAKLKLEDVFTTGIVADAAKVDVKWLFRCRFHCDNYFNDELAVMEAAKDDVQLAVKWKIIFEQEKLAIDDEHRRLLAIAVHDEDCKVVAAILGSKTALLVITFVVLFRKYNVIST